MRRMNKPSPNKALALLGVTRRRTGVLRGRGLFIA